MNASEERQTEHQLEQARQQVEHWRQTRRKLGAMPEPLWLEAAAVARKLGAYKVAHALGLNYRALKDRAFPPGRVRAEAPKPLQPVDVSTKPAAFVELQVSPPSAPAPASAGASDAVVVEVVGPSGARLTIRLKGGAVSPELAALVASFR